MDYYYDDRYDAPDFKDEESVDWWYTLDEAVMDWMATDNDLVEQYEDGFPRELVDDYMDKFIDMYPEEVCEMYDQWLNRLTSNH